MTGATGAHALLTRRAQRVRALAQLSPITDMVAARQKGFANLPTYDTHALAEAAISEVTAHMGISESDGADRDAVVDAVAGVAAAMHPGKGDAARRIAEWTVRWLLNIEEGGRARRITYADPSDGYRLHELDVTVLYETRSRVDDRLVVKADPAAVNAMLVALDQDLADAQIAAEAVLLAHIESGRLDRASAAAQQASDASAAYADDLRSVLERTRRDVTAVDWSQRIPELLERAQQHIVERLDIERQLRASATTARDEQSDPERRREAAQIVELVAHCIARHDRLLEQLLPARQVFLDEQARQRLAAARLPNAVALHADLVVPLLEQPAKQASEYTDRFADGAAGPVVPRRHGLALAIEQLLAPRRAVDVGPGGHVVQPDALELIVPDEVFDAQMRSQALALLDEIDDEQPLSTLLARARDIGAPPALVALLVNAAYAFDNDPARAVALTGEPLADPEYGGDDLLVRRAAPVGDVAGPAADREEPT